MHIAITVKVSDIGRAGQDRAWAKLGGNPTAIRLQWVTSNDDAGHADLHRRVQAMSGIRLPSKRSEESDPAGALRTYERAVAQLRERTRDASKYPRVRAELAAYGFARNAYGLRRLGITAGVLLVLTSVVIGLSSDKGFIDVELWRPIVAGLFGVLWIGVWLYWFTGEHVQRASDKYASALLDASGPS